ncbi:hypothetical protein LHGZ1_2760 [Laribacter hongkongensis]|uniref:Uncharacterized protein n=1 Tax=Laribacter hongkongensis TaxID=168471 RepID=A0A248LM84_9NEIS|nr:hypothetical protein LHGZ1_2760 [Laribacter hongkongensis]
MTDSLITCHRHPLPKTEHDVASGCVRSCGNSAPDATGSHSRSTGRRASPCQLPHDASRTMHTPAGAQAQTAREQNPFSAAGRAGMTAVRSGLATLPHVPAPD